MAPSSLFNRVGILRPDLLPISAHRQKCEITAGSPLFMSPEQATGDGSPDARSDIYSLGAVGYYLLTARPPFEGDKPIKVVIAHAHEQVVPPSRHREGIPPDLEQVILRCLAKAPTDRFQDAASLAEALAGCQAPPANGPASGQPRGGSNSRKRPCHRHKRTAPLPLPPPLAFWTEPKHPKMGRCL